MGKASTLIGSTFSLRVKFKCLKKKKNKTKTKNKNKNPVHCRRQRFCRMGLMTRSERGDSNR